MENADLQTLTQEQEPPMARVNGMGGWERATLFFLVKVEQIPLIRPNLTCLTAS